MKLLRGLWSLLEVSLLVPWLTLVLLWRRLLQGTERKGKPVLAFFHPFCNDGGGGERVAWNLVRVAQQVYGAEFSYRLYHGDAAVPGDAILAKTKERFGITLALPVQFVVLQRRHWVESGPYPVLTMMGQALGAVVLGLDALLAAPAPEVLFDTMGYAFAYPVLAGLGGCRVLCYTHYPVISTDMLERVLQRRPSHNNAATIANSAALSQAKLTYYRVFAWLYGWVGRRAALVLVNSRWTQGHINAIWQCPERTHVVYPAVDTAAVSQFPLEGREDLAISIAQFRPEKDHALQMRAWALFKAARRGNEMLVMIGSVRNEGDQAIVDGIRALGKELGLEEGRDYGLALNVPYSELLSFYARAKVGLHSMWNEHFGIGIVELMAAGVLTIAHNSGGPRSDILAADPEGAQIGFGAETAEDYAAALGKAFAVRDTAMRARARRAMAKFSEQAFAASVEKLLVAHNLLGK
jgi:alpha-1,2-mannosyltransferase